LPIQSVSFQMNDLFLSECEVGGNRPSVALPHENIPSLSFSSGKEGRERERYQSIGKKTHPLSGVCIDHTSRCIVLIDRNTPRKLRRIYGS